MRLLFIADVPAAQPESGAEQVLFQQTMGLVQAGLSVSALTRRPAGRGAAGPDLIKHDTGVIEASYPADARRPFAFLSALKRYPGQLFRDINRRQAPLTHLVVHQPFTALPLLLRGLTKKIPLLYVFHSPGHEEYLLANSHAHRWKTTLPALVRRYAEAAVIRRAKRVMVLSAYMGRKAKSIHGIDPTRIIVNPGGVDLARFCPPTNRKQLKQTLGWPEGRIHLLTIRNFDHRMGLDNLIRALALLNSQGPRYHLTLGGDGPERNLLLNLIQELGLEGDVTMTGFIPDQQMASWYGSADFFILPTRSLEGFGLVTPEALACGTPVLGTPIGGTAEILPRLDPRLLFRNPSPEALQEGIMRAVNDIFLDQEGYGQLRQRCREFASAHYSWQRHNELLLETLSQITPS